MNQHKSINLSFEKDINGYTNSREFEATLFHKFLTLSTGPVNGAVFAILFRNKRIPRRKKEASNIFPSIAEFELSAIFSHYRRPLALEETSSQKLKGNSSLNRRLRIDIPSLIPRSNEANFPPPPFRGEKRKNTRARHGYYITRGGCTNKLDEPWLSLAASNERRGFSV